MMDVKDARKVIEQLSTETFLCSDDVISTNNFVIVKKSGNVTTDAIIDAIDKIKKGGNK